MDEDDDVSLPIPASSATDLDAAAEMVSDDATVEDPSPTGGRGGGGGAASQCALLGDDIEAPMVVPFLCGSRYR